MDDCIVNMSCHLFTPPPVGGRGIVFEQFLSLFLCLFLCQQHYKKTAGPICMKFSGKVWSDAWDDLIKFWVNSDNGSAGQRSICLLSPAIAQRTGVNKSVSFARWQQGAGFVVPRTTACSTCASLSQSLADANFQQRKGDHLHGRRTSSSEHSPGFSPPGHFPIPFSKA